MIELLITFGTGLLGMWSAIIMLQTLQILKSATTAYQRTRRGDKIIFTATFLITLLCGVTLGKYLPLMIDHPGTTTALEMGLGFSMFYCHELQLKNWKRFKNRLSQLTS